MHTRIVRFVRLPLAVGLMVSGGESEGVGSGLMRAHLDHMLTYMQTGCPSVCAGRALNQLVFRWMDTAVDREGLALARSTLWSIGGEKEGGA